ncbi:MAG: hypothetical protein NT170_03730 [Candidatus Moranbacteria bacterium]|nr:hypothetical protein [Candidatus Moranbacteria bacterium]
MTCGNCKNQTDENADVCEHCGIAMAKSKELVELRGQIKELKKWRTQKIEDCKENMKKDNPNWPNPPNNKKEKGGKSFYERLTARSSRPEEAEYGERAKKVNSVAMVLLIFGLALYSYHSYFVIEAFQERLKELKSENDILADELNAQDSPSKSEDLMQKVENKERELLDVFKNKLAENFKKPDLVSAGEHLEDIELGNYKITFSEIDDESRQNNWDMKVLNGNKVINVFSSYYFSRPVQVNNGDKSLFLFQRFSGGVHCCWSVYPAVYSQQRLKFGRELDLSHYGVNGEQNFFEKDGQLYFYAADARFAYFYTSFAGSGIMGYPDFYRFNSQTAQLVPANSEFKKYYQFLYEDIDEEINKWLEGGKQSVYFDWLPWLTARSVNGLLAGNSEKDIWKEFNDDFNYFVKYHKPDELKDKTADQVKKEILEKLDFNLSQH